LEGEKGVGGRREEGHFYGLGRDEGEGERKDKGGVRDEGGGTRGNTNKGEA
jgi:hypothetical protein